MLRDGSNVHWGNDHDDVDDDDDDDDDNDDGPDDERWGSNVHWAFQVFNAQSILNKIAF